MVDSNFEIVQGRFKLPVLKGEINMHIDKYTTFENMYSNNLDNWLGNMYIEINHLPREQVLINKTVNEYDAEIAFNTEKLNLDKDYLMEENIKGNEVVREYDIPEELYGEKQGFFSCFNKNKKKQKLDDQLSRSSRVSPEIEITHEVSINANKDLELIKNSSTSSMRSRNSHLASSVGIDSENRLNNVSSSYSTSTTKTRKSTFFATAGPGCRRCQRVEKDQFNPSQYVYEVRRLGQIDMVTTRLQEGIKKTKYIRVELTHDLGLNSWKTLEFWLTIVIFIAAFMLRIWAHYLGQYLYLKALKVPVYDFAILPHTVVLKYIQEVIPLEIEIIEVVVGPLTNILVFLFLMFIGWLCRKMLGGVTDIMSKFVCWYGICTFLDPLLILFVDLCIHNYNCERLKSCKDISSSSCTCSVGDSIKLYEFFQRTEGNGIIGVFVTILIYFCLMVIALFALYTYMLYIHMNGRMLDVYRRLNGKSSTFYLPDDYEISGNELTSICSKANKWTSPDGARRRIGVSTYTLTDPLDNDFKEITTHIVIYYQDLSGEKSLYRQFLRLPDGIIIELFGNSLLNYGPQYNKLEELVIDPNKSTKFTQNLPDNLGRVEVKVNP